MSAQVEVGNERVVAGPCEAIRDTADLIIEAPPLLDDDYARASFPGGSEIALRRATVRASELDYLALMSPPFCQPTFLR